MPLLSDTGRMGRTWSFASSAAEVEKRRHEANELVGETLAAVRYQTIDYDRHHVTPGMRGQRMIEHESEWANPCWRHIGFHAVEFGIEIDTAGGKFFSVTWDPPGPVESLGIQPESLSSALRPDADVAVWDVTAHDAWRDLVDCRVDEVTLHYEPWGVGTQSFWCPQITLTLGTSEVVFLLGDATVDGDLGPAADNLAVLFNPTSLPAWRAVDDRRDSLPRQPNARKPDT